MLSYGFRVRKVGFLISVLSGYRAEDLLRDELRIQGLGLGHGTVDYIGKKDLYEAVQGVGLV